MQVVNVVLLDEGIKTAFISLVREYLPGSDEEKIKKHAERYPKTFLALMMKEEVIGVAFGWPRSLDVPGDNSFTLDGIAIKEEFQKNGYGKLLLDEFEKNVKEYGFSLIGVGSAGGYVEKFYMKNGYIPKMYKVYEESGITVAEIFETVEAYYNCQRETDGFVVMEKIVK